MRDYFKNNLLRETITHGCQFVFGLSSLYVKNKQTQDAIKSILCEDKKMRSIVNGRFLKNVHIWFENYPNLEDLISSGLNADRYFLHANNCEWGDSTEQYSLITDLVIDEEELFATLSSTLRNEIRRAGRENTTIKVFHSNDVIENESVLDIFAEIYHAMYVEKGFEGAQLPRSELMAYAHVGKLMVTAAYIHEEAVVYHSYVVSGDCSRLLHSCSEFRSEDNAARNAIGRANKMLHWEDMRTLKAMNVKKYDWGGINSFDAPNGIDRFKMSFGGERVTYYNISGWCSVKGKIIGKLLKR